MRGIPGITSVRSGDAASTTRAERESEPEREFLLGLLTDPDPAARFVSSSERSSALPATMAERSFNSGLRATSTCHGKLGIRRQAMGAIGTFSERLRIAGWVGVLLLRFMLGGRGESGLG